MSREVEEAMALLRRNGHRVTLPRRAIIEEVFGTEGHITAADIARRVQARLPRVNTSTVYRTLEMLEDEGMVSHTHSERGAEYHRAAEADHVHLTCARCGRAQDLSLREAESLRRLITKQSGFRADLTHFAISGLCASCATGKR